MGDNPFDITGDPDTGAFSLAKYGLGATNPFLLAGLNFGGNFLGQLGSLIGGASASEKRNRQLYSQFSNELNAPPPQFLDINRIFGDLETGLRPQLSAQAQHLSKRLGISSPLAQAGLAQLTASSLANLRAGLQQQLSSMQLQNLFNLRGASLQAAAGS